MRLYVTINKELVDFNSKQKCPLPDWVNHSYIDLINMIYNEEDKFPCYFANIADSKSSLIYSYFDFFIKEDLKIVSSSLSRFLSVCESIEHRAAFVVFFKTGNARDLSFNEKLFWRVLQFLHINDDSDWCIDIPKDPENPNWSFCYNNKPLFITGHSSAYKNRISRSSNCDLMLIFQTRDNLKGLVGDSIKAKKIRNQIREQVDKYDQIEHSPVLGVYGAPNFLEWKQYWLHDQNDDSYGKCPLIIK